VSDRTEATLTVFAIVLALICIAGGLAGERWMLIVGMPILPVVLVFAAIQERRANRPNR
jgi:hypothetical protein